MICLMHIARKFGQVTELFCRVCVTDRSRWAHTNAPVGWRALCGDCGRGSSC
jgi:hypothetical protein